MTCSFRRKLHIPNTCVHCAKMFNGDIRKTGVIEHYCCGCCRSRRETYKLFLTAGIWVLFGRQVKTLDRDSWTGAEGTLDQVGLGAAVHFLLPTAYLRAMPEERTAGPLPGEPHGNPALEDRPPVPPIADDPADPGPDLSAADRPHQAPPRGPAEKLGVSVYREEMKDRDTGTRKWIKSGTLLDDVVVARKHYECGRKLMAWQLRISSKAWETRQQKKALDGKERTYPLWEAYEGKAVKTFNADVGRLIFDESEWDLLGTKTERQQLTLFQISIRLGATGYQLVECRHRRPPFSTFYSLCDPGLRPTLEGAKLCTHDPYTENHMLY